MTTQDKTLEIIQVLGYNSRQVSEVLELNVKTVANKIRMTKYEKFTEAQFEILKNHLNDRITEMKSILERLEKV